MGAGFSPIFDPASSQAAGISGLFKLVMIILVSLKALAA
jgi:hypothetical protein